MSAPAELRPCLVKGCAWRGLDPYACPLHEDVTWDRERELMPEAYTSRAKSRHRRR